MSDTAWVLCDYTFLEPVDNREDPDARIRKLRSVLLHPSLRHKLLVAHAWQDLVLRQPNPDARLRKDDLIDPLLTDGLQSALAEPETAFWTRFGIRARSSPEFASYLQWKREFVERGNAFAQHAANRDSEFTALLRRDAHARLAFVRRPKLVTEFLGSRHGTDRYSTRPWRNALECFPDRLAIGRWVRLTAYFAIERLLRPDQADDAYSNNFEDATYAFLASFAGNIATKDVGLRSCIATLFPWVNQVRLEQG